MKFKYEIKHMFSHVDEVSVFTISKWAHTPFLAVAGTHLIDCKINTVSVLFDPRPLLEKQG